MPVKATGFFPLFVKTDRGINPLFNLQPNDSGENEKIARERLSRIHNNVTCHSSEAYLYYHHLGVSRCRPTNVILLLLSIVVVPDQNPIKYIDHGIWKFVVLFYIQLFLLILFTTSQRTICQPQDIIIGIVLILILKQ